MLGGVGGGGGGGGGGANRDSDMATEGSGVESLLRGLAFRNSL